MVMAHFNVTVEVIGQMSYIVEADSQEQAEQLAMDFANADTRLGHFDVLDLGIFDCADESDEHE
jgi:hypothetical protein